MPRPKLMPPAPAQTLAGLSPGDSATILALDAGQVLYHRLAALGLRAGKTVGPASHP